MRGQAKSIVGSLRMREPEELVGPWVIETGNDRCSIGLDATRVESANGWRLVDAEGCLGRLVTGAAAWRPAPEGIEFAGADRRTVLVLTAVGDAVAQATLPDGRAVRMRPASPAP